jgi:hypothetical protein
MCMRLCEGTSDGVSLKTCFWRVRNEDEREGEGERDRSQGQ